MHLQKKSMRLLFIICFILLLSTSTAFAAAGDGTGDGSGVNSGVALTLEKSSIRNDSKDVAINPTIQLNFNKNICNVLVLANNKNCFHLTDADDKPVPIKLIFPDDQVQPDYRREVFIIPQNDLLKNSTYRLSVDSTLMAKNGTYIDNAHTISFTTGEQTYDDVNPDLKALGDYTVTYETALSETEDSVPINKELLENDDEKQSLSADSISKIVVIAIVLIILLFTAVIIIKRRKRRTS